MMFGAISFALSALRAFFKKIRNTANNVENINSAGFKKRVTSFQEGGNLKGVQIVSNQQAYARAAYT